MFSRAKHRLGAIANSTASVTIGVATATAAIAIAIAAAAPAPAYATVAGRDGPIAYVDAQNQIVLINPDGTGRRVLVAGPPEGGELSIAGPGAWSNDKDPRLLFMSGDDRDLFAVPESGGVPMRVFTGPNGETHIQSASWSPDGNIFIAANLTTSYGFGNQFDEIYEVFSFAPQYAWRMRSSGFDVDATSPTGYILYSDGEENSVVQNGDGSDQSCVTNYSTGVRLCGTGNNTQEAWPMDSSIWNYNPVTGDGAINDAGGALDGGWNPQQYARRFNDGPTADPVSPSRPQTGPVPWQAWGRATTSGDLPYTDDYFASNIFITSHADDYTTIGNGPSTRLSWSPDGKHLAYDFEIGGGEFLGIVDYPNPTGPTDGNRTIVATDLAAPDETSYFSNRAVIAWAPAPVHVIHLKPLHHPAGLIATVKLETAFLTLLNVKRRKLGLPTVFADLSLTKQALAQTAVMAQLHTVTTTPLSHPRGCRTARACLLLALPGASPRELALSRTPASTFTADAHALLAELVRADHALLAPSTQWVALARTETQSGGRTAAYYTLDTVGPEPRSLLSPAPYRVTLTPPKQPPPKPMSADLTVTDTGPSFTTGPTTYAVTVTNDGPDPSSAVRLIDINTSIGPTTGDTGTFGSAKPSQGTCTGPQPVATVSCSLGTLAAGQQATVQISYTYGLTGDTYTNTATVNAPLMDPNTANNSAGASTRVRGGPGVGAPPASG